MGKSALPHNENLKANSNSKIQVAGALLSTIYFDQVLNFSSCIPGSYKSGSKLAWLQNVFNRLTSMETTRFSEDSGIACSVPKQLWAWLFTS